MKPRLVLMLLVVLALLVLLSSQVVEVVRQDVHELADVALLIELVVMGGACVGAAVYVGYLLWR